MTHSAEKGNPPLDNPVIVNKLLKANIGLKHFWQSTSQPVRAGITYMTNVANGNSMLSLTPFSEPGRGLSTVVQLTYNSLEEHSDSPVGNNWTLSITGLSRFGDPPGHSPQQRRHHRRPLQQVHQPGGFHYEPSREILPLLPTGPPIPSHISTCRMLAVEGTCLSSQG